MIEFVSIPEFCSSVMKSKPILFLGAGISLAPPSKLPVAKGLIRSFYKALTSDPEIAVLANANELPDNPFDTLSSPELIYNAVAEYAKQIIPHLFHTALDCDKPNVNHWIAAQMLQKKLAEHIITTNFDQLIEGCFGSKEVSLRLGDDDPKREFDVWKIHGDLRNSMSITLNDVALLGFSALPALLKNSLFHKKVVVAGYSGNDFHVLRAIIDAQPDRVWWIVRRGDIPEAANILSQNVPSLVGVKGDLSLSDSDNPLVALWERIGHQVIPTNLSHANGRESSACLSERLSDVLSELGGGQKGFILHSLIRRAGIKTTHKYRVRLSSMLHGTMFAKDGFSPGLGYTPGKDWVEFYERFFTPDIAARPVVLSRNGISLAESDHFGETLQNKASLGKDLSRRDEAEILLEVGLENAFRRDFERSRTILEVALNCAEGLSQRALQMKSAEGLAWVYLWLGDFQKSNECHAIYSQQIEDLVGKLRVLQDSTDPLVSGDLLKDFEPPDEPRKLYSVLALDHRYRSVVQALRLAGCLRYLGKAELGIEVLERVRLDSEQGSAYVHALRGFHRFEKGRCLFILGKVQEGLELIGSAERALTEIEDWDYEVLRQFYKSVQEYYVKAGRMGQMMGKYLNSKRVL